jgi:hypothetical protein
MITELCQELKNWFDRDLPKYFGKFSIHDADIYYIDGAGNETSLSQLDLLGNQYYRICGSIFNDGVHKYEATDLATLTNEQFDGAVWLMAIPPAVVLLANKIADWQTKYSEVSTSPYISESFGGYSRTLAKSSGGSGSGSGNGASWQNAFRSELNKWRKL